MINSKRCFTNENTTGRILSCWSQEGSHAELVPSNQILLDIILDFQKKQPDDDSAPSTSNSQSDLFSEETTSDNSNTSITTPTLSPSQQSLPTELNVTSPSKEECGPCTDAAHVSLITPTKRPCGAGYVFCMLHRLPEQHDCTFDHMGRGREEAIMKMVKLDRKVGRSCQRIGEGCS
ncbi:AN1-type zinc finger protein 3 isoform X4 [Cricetulus griseus]|uniref:AN1-type zinc finger protein 3 isoform X4 n=1 Tax=Cricetulus griseus TaxID=10029 RepID=UPI0015C2FE91|nr:AN1-type zinc finger protein 3 isoform X4 [Cricetulus griseus]